MFSREVRMAKIEAKVLDGRSVDAVGVAVAVPVQWIERAEALRSHVRRRPRLAPSGVATRATVWRAALQLGLEALERDREKLERERRK